MIITISLRRDVPWEQLCLTLHILLRQSFQRHRKRYRLCKPLYLLLPQKCPLFGNTSAFLHCFNLPHEGASCSLASQKCTFSASLQKHIFICLPLLRFVPTLPFQHGGLTAASVYPPEGMTSKDIRLMSEEALLDMDYFLNEDDLFDDEAGVEGFYIF